MAIEYNFETDFKLEKTSDYTDWIISVVKNHQAFIGDLNYIFCSDSYLLEINNKYLNFYTNKSLKNILFIINDAKSFFYFYFFYEISSFVINILIRKESQNHL